MQDTGPGAASVHLPPLVDEASYPAVRILLRHGGLLSILAGSGFALAGIGLVLAGMPWWLAAGGVAAGGLTWLLLRSYCEVLRIVTETLLPQ